MDLKLDTVTGDIVLENNDFAVVRDQEAVRQSVQMRLRMFRGEYFLDEQRGVPYLQEIFEKSTPPVIIAEILKKTIRETSGVLEIVAFDMKVENTTRQLFVDFEARVAGGTISFENFGLFTPVEGGT